jgi:ubiquinone/menaquinone biosynthesis C-methylase UbiE
MIEITNQKGLNGIVKDILSLDFKDDYFDIILCTLVINYIKDFNKFFKVMHRILKKGGLLILSDVHPIRTAVERKDGKIKSLTIKEYITKKVYNTVLGGKKIKVCRRTIGEMLNALINKFSILKVSEPYYKYKKRISDDKYYLSKNPMYIIFLARKE